MGVCALVNTLHGATLTNVASIRGLTPAEAGENLPVQLSGVVTYVEPEGIIAFLQDETGGTYFKHRNLGRNIAADIEQGQRVTIVGVTTPGQFAPHVIGPSWDPVEAVVLGDGDWPDPIRVGADELRNPAYHSQWIEIRGTIRSLELDGDYLQMQLGNVAGTILVRVRVRGNESVDSKLAEGALHLEKAMVPVGQLLCLLHVQCFQS